MESVKKHILKLFINKEINILTLGNTPEGNKEYTDILTEIDYTFYSSDKFELVAIFQLEDIKIILKERY